MGAITLGIASVTVSEDRAHVVRRGEVELPAGTTRFVVEGVAPVIADKTLKVAVDEGVAVGEVKTVRRRLHLESERPVDVAALDAEIDAKTVVEKELGRKKKRIELELAGIDQLVAQTLADVQHDASWNKFDAAACRARLRELEALERERRSVFLDAAEELRRASEDLSRLRARRATHGERTTKEAASISLVLSTDAPRRATLQIDYIVPGACWRPHHTARLAGNKVRFSTDACVWQNTGETWDEADVAFSTERPSLGREPPLMNDDWLAVQRKQEQLVVQAREEEVHTAGLGQAGETARSALPGIDDGGEARVLRGAGKATIVADGRPHRVPISSFEADATSELVMMPALAALAIKKTTQTNGGAQPILAGPVDLVEGSGVVGRTQVLFVAPGERFELGWGPDPGVRAHRQVEEVDEDPSMLSSWLARTFRVNIALSSLDPAPRTITVTEAIPVSEVEKVQIAVDAKETTDGAKPNDDGFVRWSVKLGAHGRAVVKLRYVLKRHKDVGVV